MSAPDQTAPELLPCPFCGSLVSYVGAAIRCNSFICNASMSPVWTTAEIRNAKGSHTERLRLATEQTAERWNRRQAVDMAECAPSSTGMASIEAAVEPDFVQTVMQKLRRFEEITEDVEATGVDIGRDWLDLLTNLGLLDRVQRSPALWQLTDAALRALAGERG